MKTRGLTLAASCAAILLTSPTHPLHATPTPHPSLPGPSVPDGLGVNIHFTDPAPGEMELLAAAGFRWVRMDLVWQTTEQQRGKYDFSAYDRLVNALDHHGIKAIFILDYSNPLYEPNRSVRSPEGRAAFARWAAAAAKRYQNKGYLWEIWNEPNIHFWDPQPAATDYAALSQTAAAAIRNAAPNEAIIGPATSEIDLKFIESCLAHGALNDWAAVSVHPYRQRGPESAIPEYARLRQLIAKSTPPNQSIPIISGEWGYSAAWKNYDEDLQGRMLARQLLTNLSAQIPLSIWYDWRNDGANPTEPEHHFGTVGLHDPTVPPPSLRIKPAYRAMQTLTSTLRGKKCIRRIATGSSDDWILCFADNQQQTLAVWTTADHPRTFLLPTPTRPSQTVDHLGHPLPSPNPAANTAANTLPIPLASAPSYWTWPSHLPALDALPTHPSFSCTLVPAPNGLLLLGIDNPEATAFTGTASPTGTAHTPAIPISWPAGKTQAIIPMPIHPDDAHAALGIDIQLNKQTLLTIPKAIRSPGDRSLLSRCAIKADGDPAVSSRQSLAQAANPPPLPGFTDSIHEAQCHFDPGWKFTFCAPSSPEPIPGSPNTFGLWVHGDASNVSLRMRVRDANGRTWQPDGATVDWLGWRHVRFPLSQETAHWGGNGPPTIRYPLHWEAPILIDNVSRTTNTCKLLLTAPTILAHEPPAPPR